MLMYVDAGSESAIEDGSRAHPYHSIGKAIDSAAEGDHVQVGPGTYEENLSISKTLVLTSGFHTPEGVVESAILVPARPLENVVTIRADRVMLSGFVIRGAAHPAASIFLQGGAGCTLADNVVEDSYRGVLAVNAQAASIGDNRFESNGVAIECRSVRSTRIERNDLNSNHSGIMLHASSSNNIEDNQVRFSEGNGISLSGESNDNMIRDNEVRGGRSLGISLADSCYRNTISRNTIVKNGQGVRLTSGYLTEISKNSFIENGSPQALDGGSHNTWDDGVGRGNYWSDYRGADKNGDGIGDTRLPHLGLDNCPLMEPMAIPADGLRRVTEDFSDPALTDAWQVVSGPGRYSLADNPGCLRYYLEGPQARSGGWRNPEGGWKPSMALVRQFDGSDWILTAKATYNIHVCSDISVPQRGSTGAQYQDCYIVFGDGLDDFVHIHRGTDWWYGVNRMKAALVSNGTTITECDPLGTDDLPKQKADGGWTKHTYFYRIVKVGRNITFGYSYDGVNYTSGFSAQLKQAVTGTQRVVIDANVWTTAGSYVDWDYLHVEPLGLENLLVLSIDGIGKAYRDKLQATGITTVRDIEAADVNTLHRETGISVYNLHTWKARAALAMGVKIDPKVFSRIGGMRLIDLMNMSDEDLCNVMGQSKEAASALRHEIGVLLSSLDNASVKSMTLDYIGPRKH